MEYLAAWGIRAIAFALSGRWLVVTASGLENVPRRGPVVLAARHFHYLYDGLALLKSVPRRIHVAVTLDWVQGRLLRTFMEWATRAAGWPVFLRPDALMPGADGSAAQKGSAYSVDEIGRYRRKALRDSVQLLVEGSALLVFPEGYPNVDPHYTPKTKPDELLPFHSGFAAIVSRAEKRLEKRLPVIPIGISYVPGPRWTAQLRFGAPVHLASYPSRETFVRAVERQVAELSGLKGKE